MTLKSRLLRILLVVLLVLAFVGYFAFSTFLFSPTEGDYESDVSTLVPRNVDFFVAKARLADDFDPFPHPAFERALVATAAWRAFVASEDFAELDHAWNLEDQLAQLEQLPAQLKGIAPLKVFGGRDVAIAGRLHGPDLAQAEWAVYGRANWLGKLGVSLLSYPGLLGLSSQGLTVAVEDDHVALSGGQLARELFVSRVRDVVIAGTSLDLVRGALELEARAGQDSFGQSAQYFDHVQNAKRGTARDEAELYLDWRAWSEQMQLSGRWPDPESPEWGAALAARFFQLGSVKDLAGIVGFDRGLRAHLHADLSSEMVGPTAARAYRRRGADRREILGEAAALAPSDAGLFVFLHVGVGDLLREVLATAEPTLRSNLDDVLRGTGKYSGTEELIAELDTLFRDRVALIVRRNDYPVKAEADPPNDGAPVYAVSVVFWTDGSEKARARIDELHNLVVRIQQSLGLVGREPGSPGVFRNVVQSGHEIWEFWSPLISGSGHVASVVDDRRYILSNSFRMLGDVIATFYRRQARRPSLAERVEFKGLLDEGLDQANALVWMAPRQLADTARRMAARAARDTVLGGLDLVSERVREEALVLRQDFGGRRVQDLAPDERARLDEVVDARIDDLTERALSKQAAALEAAFLRRIQYAELVTGALVMLALDPKQMELSLGAIVPLEEP